MSSLVAGRPTPPTKKAPRSTALRACERCRQRKRKCDEYFPCGTCTRLGIQCQISEPDKKQEKSQSYLEAQIKRLERLLAAHNALLEPQHRCQLAPDASAYSSVPMQEGPSKLRLQIPSTPVYSPNEPDWYPALSSDYSISPTLGSPHQVYPSLGYPVALDIPQWSSQISHSEQRDLAQPPLPRRRALSSPFPLSEGEEYHNLPDTSFDFNVDTDMLSPDIPTIQVTSWDIQSSDSAEPRGMGINDYSLMTPGLSVGSWSGPPSPTSTAASSQFNYDDPLFLNPGSRSHSRRSSFAFSDRSCDGLDFIDPCSTDAAFKPQPNASFLPSTQPAYFHAPVPAPALLPKLQLNESEMQYAKAYFDLVQPFFPIISHENFRPLLEQSAQNHNNNYQRATVFLVLSIGCHLIPDAQPDSLKYYTLAQQCFDTKALPGAPSIEAIRTYILLALHRIVCTDAMDEGAPSLYMLNAYICAACVDSSLHQQCPSDVEGDIFFTAYVLDRTTSVMTGKPYCLRDFDISETVLGKMLKQAKSVKEELQNRTSLGSLEKRAGRLLEWYGMAGPDLDDEFLCS
ncbi:hypothetical protein BP6252_00187 [Coleophoma cylindrospora]|uniref:Zn(2)-C6 fungal-type domain-containing protein n=1 Tax=Coleophoma cylindrospora TaxID=1849047 RepID=A0A3D8SPA7_9HELO|nr:hypothetical protein BP6252_00187 [Coleophoma cylindrospora]